MALDFEKRDKEKNESDWYGLWRWAFGRKAEGLFANDTHMAKTARELLACLVLEAAACKEEVVYDSTTKKRDEINEPCS